MTNNEKWLSMLEKMNFPVTDNLKNGEYVHRVTSDDGNHIRICVTLEAPIPLELLDNIRSRTQEYLSSYNPDIDVRYSISYRTDVTNDELVEEYYVDAKRVCSKYRNDLIILDKFDYIVNDNTITIKVADQMEQEIVNSHLDLIRKYFDNYGLIFVFFNVVIDEEVVSSKKKRELSFQVIDDKNTAKANEEYLQKIASSNDYEGESVHAYKRNATLNKKISDLPTTSMEISEMQQTEGTTKIEISGTIVSTECKVIRSKAKNQEFNLFTGYVTDHKDTIMFKKFFKDPEADFFKKKLKPNLNITIIGKLEWDNFARDVCVMADSITTHGEDQSRIRFDGCDKKRVELHAHSKMSVLDSILNVDEYVQQAKRFGHTACAITDHENCHVLPDFFKACKKAEIKPIAGLEANYVDLDKTNITLTDGDYDLNKATFVVFDLETTGFSVNYDDITEIGAVKVTAGGIVLDEFQTFVKPKKKISDYIAALTDISNDTVFDAPNIEMVLPEFKKFIEDSILVGHNIRFDTGFIYENMKRLGIYDHDYPAIDTLQIAKALYAEEGLKRFNLGSCAKYLKVTLEQQHRAIHDAKTTNNVFQRELSDLYNKGIKNYNELNDFGKTLPLYRYAIPTHFNILVKNRTGLKNFYKIISDSQTTHYFRYARVLLDVYNQYKEGLLLGSGCVNGEVFRAAWEKGEEELRKVMAKYDYIEVQPPAVYMHLYEKTKDPEALNYIQDTIKRIIRVADELGKPVCATGDVHELLKEDCEFRKIYLSVNRPNGGGPHELNGYDDILDMHFRSTSEMLEEFSFLDNDKAFEIVVTNPNKIADLVEEFDLFPKEMFIPRDDFRKDYGVPSMKQAIIDMCHQNVVELYGSPTPAYVEDRMNKELDSIISHGYFSVYYISHMLVENSNKHGYIVGSRGSVGSSFVARLMNITEVNPLVPHYRCPHCKFSAFKFVGENKDKYAQPDVPDDLIEVLNNTDIGYDLPKRNCPKCGSPMISDGAEINFETFLGFHGEKCPDIDLNFSGDYQEKAHLFTQEVFGKDYAFRAGTVGTVATKTAFAYVRDYYSSRGEFKRQAEMERLATFLEGSKKTTGQHPGGIVVVPDTAEIYDVTPVQYPPVTDKDVLEGVNWRTTHFDYHSFESNLLKLDILGHDDPTLLKYLIEYVQAEPDKFPFDSVETIPYVDDKILSLFKSKEALNIEGDDMDQFSSGTIGLPEFGTDFVRRMLETIKPKNHSEVIKVSGLAHGTNVWNGNAEALVLHQIPEFPEVAFSDVTACRDDIMVFLIKHNVENSLAFKIMEAVRKGKGLTPDQEANMREHDVPEWFIWNCKKIAYLFPKAHATAYVINALRIAWFKVYRPIYYYSVYFTVRAKAVDPEIFCFGKNAIKNKINEIKNKMEKREEVTNKETELLEELYIALEMILRGFSFKMIDIEKSDATHFVISEDGKSLYMPFVSVDALGESVANSIADERKKRPFTSKKDVQQRTAINKTQYAKLLAFGSFDSLPDDDPNSLF